MRILVVTDGLEPLLARTFVGLADLGHQVRVVGARDADELDPADAFRLGRAFRVRVQDREAPERRLTPYAASLARAAASNPAALKAAVQRTRRAQGYGQRFHDRMRSQVAALEAPADVVYFEAANVAAEHAAILDLLPPKVVMCTGSDVRVLPDRSPWLARALPGVFAAMSSVVCRSHDLRDWAERRGAPSSRTVVLHPAVDSRVFTPPDRPPRGDTALRLVSVGRLHWIKGYEFAIEAVAQARASGIDCTLTIVGPDTGARDSLEYAIRDRGLDGVVTLAGSRSAAGVRAALARADAFALSSVGEGASRAALEAMAMGLPVVTTDAGGMREIVTDQVDGLVVPRRDPTALAHAFTTLARDPGRRCRMGLAARARAEDFAIGPQIAAVDELLRAAATHGPSPRSGAR